MTRALLRRLLPVALALASAACASDGGFTVGDVEVRVEGSSVRTEDLLDRVSRELAAFGEGRHRAAHAADAAYGIEQDLLERGFAHASVGFELLPDEDAPRTLVLRVDEGPPTTLGEVSFPGRETFRTSDLEPYLRRRGRSIFGGAPAFRMADVDAAIADIERVYVLAGHHRVRVGPAEITWSDDRRRADVAIPIAEGRRFTVSAAELTGPLSDEARRALLPLLPAAGDPFHLRVDAEAAARVRGWLREQGHRTAVVTATHEIERETATARVRVHAEPGPVHVLGDLRVSGLARSDPAFVTELLELDEGQVLRQSALDDAVDALFRTGAFERVRLSPPPEGAEGDPLRTDLEVLVEEAEARSFEAGGGWGSYELLRGWVAYRDRNFTGRARSLDVEATASFKSAGIGLRAADRYILGADNTLSSGVRYEFREEPSFDSRAIDADVQIRHDLDAAHHVTYGYRIRIEEARDRAAAIRGAEFDRSRAAGLFSSLVHDTRDDRLFPRRGVFAEGGLFWSSAALGADLQFLEWHGSWARYVPLGDGTVLAVGARFATRELLDGATTLPIQERLFLGGETSVRSFREGELGPTGRDGDPKGGLTSAVASVGLRQRL